MHTKKMIDQRFLKLKAKRPTRKRAAVDVPAEVLDYVLAKGVNVSEVYRAALEAELQRPAPSKDHPAMRQSVFWVEPELLEQIKTRGVSIKDTCTKALERLYADLKLEETKGSKSKTKGAKGL